MYLIFATPPTKINKLCAEILLLLQERSSRCKNIRWATYPELCTAHWTALLCKGKVCADVQGRGKMLLFAQNVSSSQMSRQSQWWQEGELFTFSNIYFCIRYQVHKCKYSESIIKSIRNYRECNTNRNKLNMLELSSYHTCKSACQSFTTKVLGFVFFFSFFELYKTDYHKYRLLFISFVLENTKTSVYNSI